MLLFCGLFANTATAQKNIGWTGASNNNWSDASNWNYPAITSVATFAAKPEVNLTAIFSAGATSLVFKGDLSASLPLNSRVSGLGIAPNTLVTLVTVATLPDTTKQTTVTISIGTTAASDAAGNLLIFKFNVDITLTVANSDISIGDKVAGYGIPSGTTVKAIDVTKKIITLSGNTNAGVGTPGTNVQFTFAIPKTALAPPSIVDIALISNGGNPTILGGTYYLGGLIISNATGAIGGSTLTIPADVEIFVESLTNEAVLVKGGNIVNNGYFDIKSSLAGGTNNTVGAYGMTFGLPAVVPGVPTEYSYSGSGTLKIDTSAGNNFSGGINFNGADANAANVTYKLLFNGTTNFLLSAVKSGTGTASTHLFRALGVGALASCKVILGGAGFDIGDSFSGGVNGLIAASGGGIDVTIAQGTTINVYTNSNNPMALMSMYVFGATSIPAFIKNKGTITMKGTMPRSPISLSAQNNGIVNIVNDGIIDIDVNSTTAGQGGIAVTNNGGATLPADVIVTNTGTLSIKTLLNGPSWGAPIVMTTFSGAPNLHVNNSGTLNLIGSNYNFGARVYIADPLNTSFLTQTGSSRITNSGTINTNQELRTFYTINTSTGKINFASTSESPLKLFTFTLPVPVEVPVITFSRAAAAVGTTYTDENLNVYTVVVAKVATTGTTLVTHVASNAVNPPTRVASAGPPVVTASSLTKTGAGAGDASIVFTGITTNNNNALFAATLNSGSINTNTGITAMTGISGVTTPGATSVLSPGGDSGKSIATFGEVAGDAYTLRGTLKMQTSGNTTPGVDYDLVKFTGALDQIDISAATLDLTGIYTPTAVTTIDIITTFIDPAPVDPASDKSGAIVGEFASVVGKTTGWTVVYPGGLGGKVQLVYDPNLATTQFSNFKFSVYPNPTSDQLNLSAAKTISKVELFNLLGQRVQSNTVNANQKQLSISNLQNGVYLMEVTIDNAKQAFKIIKQ